jgi:hypothetical protein
VCGPTAARSREERDGGVRARAGHPRGRRRPARLPRNGPAGVVRRRPELEAGTGRVAPASRVGGTGAEPGMSSGGPACSGIQQTAWREQAANRGLRDLLLSSTYGHDRVARARERLAPITAQLLERAQKDGDLRPDLAANDVPLLYLMLGAIVDYTRDVEPAVWRHFSRSSGTASGHAALSPTDCRLAPSKKTRLTRPCAEGPPWRADDLPVTGCAGACARSPSRRTEWRRAGQRRYWRGVNSEH